MVSGFNAKAVGEQTLTISYKGRSFTFVITLEEHPFVEVYTILDLYNIRYNLDGNYILMNDIDLTAATAEGGDWDFDGRGWNPIGGEDIYSNSAFSGIFDGNGHSIKGMRINLTNSNAPSGIVKETNIGLFANVTGGHIIIICLISMIFIVKSYVMAIPSILLALIIFVLELIFGALQAYIFTLLSALYIGLAVKDEH
jgi:hypothetical protein